MDEGFRAKGLRPRAREKWRLEAYRSSPFRTGRSAYRLPNRRHIDLRVYQFPKLIALGPK